MSDEMALLKLIEDYVTFRIGMHRHAHRCESPSYIQMSAQADAIIAEIRAALAAERQAAQPEPVACDACPNEPPYRTKDCPLCVFPPPLFMTDGYQQAIKDAVETINRSVSHEGITPESFRQYIAQRVADWAKPTMHGIAEMKACSWRADSMSDDAEMLRMLRGSVWRWNGADKVADRIESQAAEIAALRAELARLREERDAACHLLGERDAELAAVKRDAETLRAALAELVALKDLKAMHTDDCGELGWSVQVQYEYLRRKPLAWAAAREALKDRT